MVITFLCALLGVVVGCISTAFIIYRLCFSFNYKDDDFYELDSVEVQTPSYEECNEFNELFDDMEAMNV